MKDRSITLVTRPAENRVIHRRATQEECRNNEWKSLLATAKNVLEHLTEQLKLGILVASVPVIAVGLACLCVISIGLSEPEPPSEINVSPAIADK
jgi:hypothetical protein